VKHRFQVTVTLKEGLANPEGKAIEDAAPTMGWDGVTEVRVGKHITFSVDADSPETARRIAGEMAERLLSNPVIEEYSLMSSEGQDL
jgi:phosphoribosylformylglycinamidine synthase